MSTTYYSLKVKALNKTTADSLTVKFEIPDDLKSIFQYKAGQYLTIKTSINGIEDLRSYSLNSAPNEAFPEITIKRVKGGKISNYLNDNLKVGDSLEVLPPQGRFIWTENNEAENVFLFAAGSGVTPVMAIAKNILQNSPSTKVHMLYGNRTEDDIIFKQELEGLMQKYPGKIHIEHTLTNGKSFPPWKKWKGRKGRVDASNTLWFLSERNTGNKNAEAYICGPGNMNTLVAEALKKAGINESSIFYEDFYDKSEKPASGSAKTGDGAQLTAEIDGQKYSVNVKNDQTLLEALQDTDADAPFSCESGYCGTCIAKLKSGKAEMRSCMALSDDEIADGYILTCQAIPLSDTVEVEYED